MKLTGIQELTDKLLTNAKAIMRKEGGLQTAIFCMREDKVGPPIMAKTSDMSEIKDLIGELFPVSDAVILIMQAHLKWFDKKEAVPKDFKNHEDSYTALIALIQSKEGSAMRQIGYIKHEDNTYSFSEATEAGWKITSSRDFKNDLFVL